MKANIKILVLLKTRGEKSLKEIAREEGRRINHMSLLLSKLEKKGFIKNINKRYTITQKGITYLEEYYKQLLEKIQQDLEDLELLGCVNNSYENNIRGKNEIIENIKRKLGNN